MQLKEINRVPNFKKDGTCSKTQFCFLP